MHSLRSRNWMHIVSIPHKPAHTCRKLTHQHYLNTKLGSKQRHVARNHFMKQTKCSSTLFLIDVISKPLTELPPNFEIGYADEDFCCSVDITSISAWNITTSINIIGVTTGIMDGTIEWLNLYQNWTKDEPQGQWTHLPF